MPADRRLAPGSSGGRAAVSVACRAAGPVSAALIVGVGPAGLPGRLLWISSARPGRTSEITACRHDRLTRKLREVGLGAIADLGFVGPDDGGPDADPAVITGCRAARNRP